MKPFYADGKTRVCLGDLVTLKIFFVIKRRATVVYVPGVSPKNDNLEYDGLVQVGFLEDGGGAVSTFVDPETNLLPSRIKFLARGKFVPDQGLVDPFQDD